MPTPQNVQTHSNNSSAAISLVEIDFTFWRLTLKGLNVPTETILKSMSLRKASEQKRFYDVSRDIEMKHWRENGLIKERKNFDPTEPSIVFPNKYHINGYLDKLGQWKLNI